MSLTFTDLTPDIGHKLSLLARETLETLLVKKHSPSIPHFDGILGIPCGVFCTLTKHGELRGCIGFPSPIYPLGKALIQATQFAALEDPRFPPVSADELADIHIEISVLTTPEKLLVQSPDEYKDLIVIGRDGLIVSKGHSYRGLLLPQVATEYNWNVEEFLDYTCQKAGLPFKSWMDIEHVHVERFQGKIFDENE